MDDLERDVRRLLAAASDLCKGDKEGGLRECCLEITDEQLEDLQNAVFSTLDGENVRLLCLNTDTTLIGVDKPGKYSGIYRCSDDDAGLSELSELSCIVDTVIYGCFSGIADLGERKAAIHVFSGIEAEKQQGIVEMVLGLPAADRSEKRAIVSKPDELRMLYSICKSKLSTDIRYECEQLIPKLERGSSSGSNVMLLTDILYSCYAVQKQKRPFLSTQECLEVFHRRRYGDDPWIRDVVRQLRLLNRCDDTGTVFVLAGAPGLGKTDIAEAIAECTGKRFCSIKCQNKNALELGGTHRTYNDSQHGEVQECFTIYGNDAVILLDEFDKMVYSQKEGNPFSVFGSAFDDRKTFIDAYVHVPVSTKDLIWILTVNSLAEIPEWIINRFQEHIFLLSDYSADIKTQIGKQFIVPKLMRKYKFTEKEVRFTDEAVSTIASSTNDAGARITAQRIEKVLSFANERIEAAAPLPIVIDVSFVAYALQDAAKTYERRSIGF